jgi:hypothetical protein
VWISDDVISLTVSKLRPAEKDKNLKGIKKKGQRE